MTIANQDKQKDQRKLSRVCPVLTRRNNSPSRDLLYSFLGLEERVQISKVIVLRRD